MCLVPFCPILGHFNSEVSVKLPFFEKYTAKGSFSHKKPQKYSQGRQPHSVRSTQSTQPPALSTPPTRPAHLSFCSLTSPPPQPQTWSEAPGHKGSPAALSHGKSLQPNYSTSALIIRIVYSSAFAADQREEKDGHRAACAFVRHRKYVTVHPTHCQALRICFSHQRHARGKTNVVPSCLFRTAETLELILGLLEIQDFQLFAVVWGE